MGNGSPNRTSSQGWQPSAPESPRLAIWDNDGDYPSQGGCDPPNLQAQLRRTPCPFHPGTPLRSPLVQEKERSQQELRSSVPLSQLKDGTFREIGLPCTHSECRESKQLLCVRSHWTSFPAFFPSGGNLSIDFIHRPLVIDVFGNVRPRRHKRIPERIAMPAMRITTRLRGSGNGRCFLGQEETHKQSNCVPLRFVEPLNLFFKHCVWHFHLTFHFVAQRPSTENTHIIPQNLSLRRRRRCGKCQRNCCGNPQPL